MIRRRRGANSYWNRAQALFFNFFIGQNIVLSLHEAAPLGEFDKIL